MTRPLYIIRISAGIKSWTCLPVFAEIFAWRDVAEAGVVVGLRRRARVRQAR